MIPPQANPAAASWDRVAQSFFRSPRAPRFRVGVAGSGDEALLREVGEALQAGVHTLSGFGVTGIGVHELGIVCEDRLDRLARELPEELDLLVWVGDEESLRTLRTEYLLGVFAWATAAARVLCVVPREIGPGAREGLIRALAQAVEMRSLEFQVRPRGSGIAWRRWWLGLLQASMAREDARRRRHGATAMVAAR